MESEPSVRTLRKSALTFHSQAQMKTHPARRKLTKDNRATSFADVYFQGDGDMASEENTRFMMSFTNVPPAQTP